MEFWLPGHAAVSAAFAATQGFELVHISEHAECCASEAAARQHEGYLAFSL